MAAAGRHAPRRRRVACEAGAVRREVLTAEQRSKLAPGDDAAFYAFPRLVTHVDDQFLADLTELYRRRIPAGGRVLDLQSSWVSHLPPEVQYGEVVGHGMNAEELARNTRLARFFVRDLNKEPVLPSLESCCPDASFDAVLSCCSVQYLQQPEAVFAEIFRVLKPGGVCIVSFSNRMFYEKAIAAWRDGTGYSRASLVSQYFNAVEGFTEPEVVQEVAAEEGREPTPLDMMQRLFQRSANDPFYAVIAYRNFKREEA